MKKNKNNRDNNREFDLDYFRLKLVNALQILVSAYYSPLLRWWETLIIVIVGILAGLLPGLFIGSLIFKTHGEKVIYLQLNETHMIRIPIPPR